MTLEEWKARYKEGFMRAGNTRSLKLSESDAQRCVDSAEFPEVMDGFEDDPEGAAEARYSIALDIAREMLDRQAKGWKQ